MERANLFGATVQRHQSDRAGVTAEHAHIQGEDLVVPPNAYFGMGDHRGVSLDSRFIPRQNVIGSPCSSTGPLRRRKVGTQNLSWDRVGFLAHVVILSLMKLGGVGPLLSKLTLAFASRERHTR